VRLRGKTSAKPLLRQKAQGDRHPRPGQEEEGAAKIRQSDKSTSLHVRASSASTTSTSGIKRFHCWYDEKERMAMIDISRPSPRGRPAGHRRRGVTLVRSLCRRF